jgi:cell pole-organizing protein PopZ
VPEVRPVLEPGLVAPEAAAAAASSLGSLVRTLTAERTTRIHAGGPTIEDIVREELRPLLQDWLNANLPPLVERLVRVEIERVVGRVVP